MPLPCRSWLVSVGCAKGIAAKVARRHGSWVGSSRKARHDRKRRVESPWVTVSRTRAVVVAEPGAAADRRGRGARRDAECSAAPSAPELGRSATGSEPQEQGIEHMTAAPPRRTWLFLITVLVPQVLIGAVGALLLDDLGRRHARAAAERSASLSAIANLHSSLTDAERMTLFAVIQGDRLHPDVPAGFRACIERAREECRAARASAGVLGEGPEVERLAVQVDEVARRGNALIASPAVDRLARYQDPDTGFQAAVTAAWRHLSRIRAMNEVAQEGADQTAREAGRQAAWVLGGTASLSLLVTLLVALRFLRTDGSATTTLGRAQQRHAEPGAAADGGGR
jgi:hypothetical protein